MLLRSVLIGGAAALSLSVSPAFAGGFDSERVSGSRALSSFDAVYIAPVNVALDHDVRPFDHYGAGDRPVTDSDAAMKAADFHAELVDEFSGSFAIAGAPGPDVLTVEATLTKLEASRPTQADYRYRSASLSPRSVYAGGADMTVTFSVDGAPLAEVTDSFDTHLRDARARSGIWSDVDRAFRSWSSRLVDFAESN